MSLRLRLLLALAPLAVLLAVLALVGVGQLDRTGGRIDAILRENYASVRAMYGLGEAAGRIDDAFRFALAGSEDQARERFTGGWATFDGEFAVESANVTIHPTEDELVARLGALRDDYRTRGKAFFASPSGSPARRAAYDGRSGDPGLHGRVQSLLETSHEILRINQENMEAARDEARATARTASIGVGAGLVAAFLLVAWATWYLLRTILAPIHAITGAAQAIGLSGQLDRRVPVYGRDELGRLAESFNAMTGQLQAYRQTNLSRLMRAQRTAQATIDSFPDPVLVLDPGGRVELANPAARLVFGVGSSTADPPGLPWQPPEALGPSVRDALQAQRASLAESFDQVVSFRLGDGERAYLPQVRPIRESNGDTLGAALVLVDVTRFRLLDQFKSDLVATVSHELKTPLTSLRLAVHVLLEENVGPLNAKQTELLVDGRESAERLVALIDQLLAMARLQRPGSEASFRPVPPGDLLRRAAEAIRGRAEDKRVEIVVAAGDAVPPVHVDPERIGLALGNLLDNALAYTPAGGRVTLSAAATADGHVELSVADNGIGIPPEHLSHVFERFFRVPGQSVPSGTGLGLAIVDEVAAAHGGRATCESEPGRATTFRLVLPARIGTEGGRP